MIRAIVFDFGNVIDAVDMSRFISAIARTTRLSPDAVEELISHTAARARDYESGTITSDEFFADVVRTRHISIGLEEFRRAFNDIFTPIPSTHELIRNLKPHYLLGLLSNTNAWHFESRIRPCPVFPLFNAVTLSYVFGMMKPAEAIYRECLRRLGVRADEALYIDDLAENVDAALQVGMRAIVFRSPASLVSDLRNLGIRLP